VHYPDQPLEVERGVSGSQVGAGYVQQGASYVQGQQGATTTTYTTSQPVYVSGQSGAGYTTGQAGYVSGSQAYTTGQTGYVTGGQTYVSSVQPAEKVYASNANVAYTTGPVQTTYEYVNAPGTYVEGGQRWESSAPYGERTTYEYVNYPESAYVTQQK
jgi:hypothetical protein